MTLSSALRTATSSLTSTSKQASIVSRNIAGVGDANYTRREAVVLTGLYGTTRVETQRVVNQSVFDASVLANARSAKSEVIAQGMDRLAVLQEMNGFSFSPAKMLGDLQQATEFAASAPSDSSALAALVEDARSMAGSLNSAYNEILSMRTVADQEIQHSVNKLNDLLIQLEKVNHEIVQGTRSGEDVFDQLDIRDEFLVQISEEIGINVIQRENNDIILTASNGVIVFEGKPRSIEFQSSAVFGPDTIGSALYIDGVAVSGVGATLPIYTGKISGNIELRDNLLVKQQNQLDEIARGLIELYSEQDQTGGGKPNLAGLLTWSGGPAIPASSIIEPGIALSIKVNLLVDQTSGGNPTLLRDGAINGDPDYLSNIAGGAGFSDRLYELSEAFNSVLMFDPASGLPTDQSLTDFAASSLNWLNASRQNATDSSQYHSELALRFKETLQNEGGPNLDYEMSRLLEIERAYQATAKLISAVDDMLATLIESV